VVVNTPRLVINNKRQRGREEDSDDVRVLEISGAAKRPRLDFQNQNHHHKNKSAVNGGGGNGTVSKDGKTRDNVLSRSDTISGKKLGGGTAASPRSKGGPAAVPTVVAAASNHKQQQQSMLNKQLSMAQRAGKVKTTRELVENLGIEPSAAAAAASRQSSLSPPPIMTSLVPSENKEELMKRFFESQQQSGGGDTTASPLTERLGSRPPSAVAGGLLTSSSATVSQASSRAATPHLPSSKDAVVSATGGGNPPTVDDILAQLPPIDPAAVLAEWSAQMEAEEEIDGLIPVFRPPPLEVTSEAVAALNGDKEDGGGGLEHVGGITDHAGVFREWHEMVARARGEEEQSEDLLYILPYTLIE
jgi:hypothetical protein